MLMPLFVLDRLTPPRRVRRPQTPRRRRVCSACRRSRSRARRRWRYAYSRYLWPHAESGPQAPANHDRMLFHVPPFRCLSYQTKNTIVVCVRVQQKVRAVLGLHLTSTSTVVIAHIHAPRNLLAAGTAADLFTPKSATMYMPIRMGAVCFDRRMPSCVRL